MTFYILTLFPESVMAMLNESILKRAAEKEIIQIEAINIRDFSNDKHKRVDDAPYGGGNGMIMKIEPVKAAMDYLCEKCEKKPYLIYMSPCGEVFRQETAKRLRKEHDTIAILCGHYEGIDERIIESMVDEEISIGDFVLTGGEIPAAALVDAVARLVPGVLSEEGCFQEESHYSGLLEHPQYTRPPEFEGMRVPEVLQKGHHAMIEEYKRFSGLQRTKKRRPDMFARLTLSAEELAKLAAFEKDL